MARQISLPVNFKVAQVLAPQTTNAALTSQVLDTRGAAKLWVTFEFNQAVGFASTPTLMQATTLAASTNKAGPAVAIWANENTATNDTLVRQTSDASSYAVSTSTTKKQIVFEVDTSRLDVANGYSYVYFTMATSSQATNFVAAWCVAETSYAQSNPPSIVV
jgi:hypothetical protein